MLRYLVYSLLLFNLVRATPVLNEGTNEEKHSPVIKTTYGNIRGLRKVFNGDKTYDAFLGIPSAKPPVGPLRWERPLPPESWEGVKDVSSFSLGCTSIEDSPTDEDCLYLNVFVPEGVDAKRDAPLPVMTWAHGGGFILGSASEYPGQELAITGNVIVVTFNYRLSALGGLSTSDATAPGNYHLWDARAALLWIKDNIKQLGGDPSRVTLFGESAGGVLASHMALSPLTDGLIHRVIVMSGNARSPIGLQQKSRENAQHLANLEECPEQPTSELVKCLRQRDADELDQAGYISMVAFSGTIPGWLPTVDGNLVVDKPSNVWSNGGAKNIDYMVGRNEHETAGIVYFNPKGEPRNITLNLAGDKFILDLAMRFLLQSYAPGDVDDLIDAIRKKYPGFDSDDELTRTKAVVQLFTDWIWVSSAHYEAEAHARNAASSGKNTYLYNFKYRPSFVHYAPWVQGSHSDMNHFVFGEPFMRDYRREKLGQFSEVDNTVKDNVMKYFSNFAHTGDPNKGPHKVVAQWPKYDPATQQYLEVSSEMTSKKQEKDLLNRINFWLEEWPKITLPDSPQVKLTLKGKARINNLMEVVKKFVKVMG